LYIFFSNIGVDNSLSTKQKYWDFDSSHNLYWDDYFLFDHPLLHISGRFFLFKSSRLLEYTKYSKRNMYSKTINIYKL
jgi:hypothetical protein